MLQLIASEVKFESVYRRSIRYTKARYKIEYHTMRLVSYL